MLKVMQIFFCSFCWSFGTVRFPCIDVERNVEQIYTTKVPRDFSIINLRFFVSSTHRNLTVLDPQKVVEINRVY